VQAYQSRDWEVGIQVLEELVRKSRNYKDASNMLVVAKKQKQLIDLYTEAQQLYAANQWKAVVKIFENIASIDENYPDPEKLLLVAQKELDELRRVDEINTLYGQAVYEIDAGNWYEARSLLEQVHKTQIGFLEIERLLRKVENEIVKIDKLNQRNIQINNIRIFYQ